MGFLESVSKTRSKSPAAVEAADPRAGLTIGELTHFLNEAKAAGALVDDRVQCQVNIGAGIKSLWLVIR